MEDDTRQTAREMDWTEKAQIESIKKLGQAFIDECRGLRKRREVELAITNARQAVFWAVTAITAGETPEE